MINTEKLTFKKFCMTIGNLPSSYVESLSYYECLMWLCKYLEDTVIPAINNNAEALTELQGLYIELKSYVDNYFDNLDVQEEINNKLDDMVEAGTLQEIIADYLNAKAVFGFDTVGDMIEATNLIDGSYARTCGKDTFNDGNGHLYKIRTITNEDVVDNNNIIAMTSDNSLVAVKVIDNELSDLVVFGDSWSDTNVTDAIWSPLAASNLGLTLKNYAINGARMTLSLAGEINNYLTHNDPTRAKYIVILGGLNDYDIESATYTNLANAIKTGISTLQTNCPQAKIIYVSNCSYPFTYSQSQYWKNVHLLVRATGIATYNMDGTWGRNVWNTANYRHLTQEGQKYMCSNIVGCLTGGEIQGYRETRQYETDKVVFDYAVERDGNMINMFAMITPKDNTITNFSFSLPEGEQNISYAGLFNTQGIIGSSYRVGVCDINAQGVTIVFQSTPNEVKYFIKANFPIL